MSRHNRHFAKMALKEGDLHRLFPMGIKFNRRYLEFHEVFEAKQAKVAKAKKVPTEERKKTGSFHFALTYLSSTLTPNSSYAISFSVEI